MYEGIPVETYTNLVLWFTMLITKHFVYYPSLDSTTHLLTPSSENSLDFLREYIANGKSE